MDRIKMTSRGLSLFFFITCGVYPFIHMYDVVYNLPRLMRWTLLPVEQLSNFSLPNHLLILALSYIPVVFLLMIYFQLGQLFRLYEKKIFFERETIARIHRIGKYMLLSQLIQCLLYEPLMMLLLTSMQPSGHRAIMISFATTNLSTLATGVIIIMTSWIANEANKLKKDVQLTI